MAEIGSIIDEKYKILEKIGSGGMSTVYLARDHRLNKQWAIKAVEKYARDPVMNEIVVSSAIAEAHMVKSLDNYYLPRINDILDDGKTIYVVMDYVEGQALNEILKNDGAQPQNQVIKWGRQLCEVLNYLHTRKPPIIYRDMKPANVMIKPDGDVKLIDFGIAKEFKERGVADTTSLGTRGYAAPEQFVGGSQSDVRTDIYNLGATLYHAVTGHDPSKDPYVMHPIRYWNPKLSGGLENIILKCTESDPSARYQSMLEVLYALNHYDQVDDLYIKRQKSKLKKFAIIVALFVVFAAFGIFSLGWSSHLVAEDYESELNIADSSVDESVAVAAYEKAILIDPSRPEAYGLDFDKTGRDQNQNIFSALSGEFNGDEYIFDKDEEKRLQILLTNVELKGDLIGIWKEQGYYSELAYRIGNIYWKYYIKKSDSGDSEINNDEWLASEIDRQTKSMKWFGYVIKDKEDKRLSQEDRILAEAYYDIGSFTKRRLNDKDQTAFDAEDYKEHFDKLGSTFDLLAKSDDKQAKLTLDSIILGNINTNLIDFHEAKISDSDLMALIDKVRQDISEIEVAKSQMRLGELKNRLLDSVIPDTENAISREYGEGAKAYEAPAKAVSE